MLIKFRFLKLHVVCVESLQFYSSNKEFCRPSIRHLGDIIEIQVTYYFLFWPLEAFLSLVPSCLFFRDFFWDQNRLLVIIFASSMRLIKISHFLYITKQLICVACCTVRPLTIHCGLRQSEGDFGFRSRGIRGWSTGANLGFFFFLF